MNTSEARGALRVTLEALPVGVDCTFANGCTVRRVSELVYVVTSPRYGVETGRVSTAIKALTNASFDELTVRSETKKHLKLLRKKISWNASEREM